MSCAGVAVWLGVLSVTRRGDTSRFALTSRCNTFAQLCCIIAQDLGPENVGLGCIFVRTFMFAVSSSPRSCIEWRMVYSTD